jgi:DNA end-binding protein Ku
MNMVAIGTVVLTNREHIIALEPLDKGLMGTLLRYPYEVRDESEYFDEIQDVKAELMVTEKIHAAVEAAASLMTGASADQIIHRYRQHVARNAKRLGKPRKRRRQW